MHRRLHRLILLSLTLAAGCESYRPLDLMQFSPSTLVANPTSLRERAEALQNPMLHVGDLSATNGYTPEQLAVVAVVLNPTLRGLRDKNTVASATANGVTILPNPTLSYTLDIPFGKNSTGLTGYGLGIDWEITSLLSHGAKKAAATQVAEQGRLDTAWQEWQIAQAARQAAYDVLALRQQLKAAEALANQLDRIATNAKAALDRHDLTVTDASAATTAAGEAHITVASTRRDLADAELALKRAVGIEPGEAILLNESVKLPSQLNVPEATTLIEHLEDRRIDLVALRRGYNAQEETVRGAILAQFPKIGLGISHTRDTGDFYTIGPSFTIDLPVFNRNQGVIAVERATRQQLFDEYHSRAFEARSDIARAVAAIHAIIGQINVTAGHVAGLQKLVSADEQALKEGNLDVATFYAASVSLAQRQVDLAKLQQDLMHGLITLELAANVYLPQE